MKRSQRFRVLMAMEGVLGGTLRHLDYLLHFLNADRWEVHLAVSARRAPHVRKDFRRWMEAGWRVHEIPMCREIVPSRDLRAFQRLISLCHHHQFDLVHSHCAKAGVLARLAAAISGARVVHTPHVFPFSQVNSSAHRTFYRIVECSMGWVTDRYILLSEYQRNQAIGAGVAQPEQCELIPNGIRGDDFEGPSRPEARNTLNLSPEAPLALFAGRFRPRKGLDVLLKAAHTLKNGRPNIRTVIVGEGPMKRWLNNRIETLDLTDTVLNRGYTERMELYYAAADLVVMPSRAEGMPYVALESMAAGRPVAASLVSGMEQFIEHGRTGLLFPPDNPDALADLLSRWLPRRAELDDMGRRAREQFPDRWNARRMARSVESLYERLLRDGKGK